MKAVRSVVRVMTVVMVGFVFSGCGGSGSSEQVPVDVAIVMSPPEIEWKSGGGPMIDGICYVDETFAQFERIDVRIIDGEDRALGDVTAEVLLDLTDNTADFRFLSADGGTAPVLELYDDVDGNGLLEDEELRSGEGQPILRKRTDEYGGHFHVYVRTNLSCPFTAGLTVRYGGFVGVTEIKVETEDETNPGSGGGE